MKFSEYTRMKQDLSTQINAILLEDGIEATEQLKEPRRHQVLFLEQFIKQLDDYSYKPESGDEDKPNSKGEILTAGMYMVREEITRTYGGSEASAFAHSRLFRALTVCMGITPKNSYDAFSQQDSFDLLNDFIIELTHVDGKLKNKLRPDHPFAGIQDFNLQVFNEIRFDLKKDACIEYNKQQNDELNSAKEGSDKLAAAKDPSKQHIGGPSFFSLDYWSRPQQPLVITKQASVPTSTELSSAPLIAEPSSVQPNSTKQSKRVMNPMLFSTKAAAEPAAKPQNVTVVTSIVSKDAAKEFPTLQTAAQIKGW